MQAMNELLSTLGPLLGLPAAQPPPPSIDAVVSDADAATPVIFLLSSGQVRGRAR